MIRKIAACLLLGVSACTIIPDDSLTELPANFQVRQLKIDFNNKNTGEQKQIDVNVTRSIENIEINWPTDIDIFFYNKNASKSVYQLNTAGYAEKITTTFVDGKEIVDEIVYDGSNRIAELRNSFFNDRLKFFYKNNQLDSIAKTRILANGTTQTGFYKRTAENTFISIFPFNSGQAYSLNYEIFGNCSCEVTSPTANELNKTGYSISDQINFYNNSYYLDINFRQTLNNQFCKKVFSNYTSESGLNYVGQPSYRGSNSSDCYNTGQTFISVFTLIPAIVPNFSAAYFATLNSELKWINSNPAKISDWIVTGFFYSYAPVSK